MNSLLTKRLPGILALGLVTLAVGAAGSPASAATSSGANISGLTKGQAKAKKKALKKCNKKKARTKKATRKKRSACKKHVKKKYKKIANALPPGKTTTVFVEDDFFSPGVVDIKVNDAILWSWENVGGFEPHNVVLDNGPSGVNRDDYNSGQPVVDRGARFKRAFIKPGTYNFYCAIHANMTMTVNVSK